MVDNFYLDVHHKNTTNPIPIHPIEKYLLFTFTVNYRIISDLAIMNINLELF